MTPDELRSYFEIGKSAAWIIGGIVASIWALQKFYLSNVYVSKKDFDEVLKTFESAIQTAAMKGNASDNKFEVFLATYKGDMALMKQKGEHNEEYLKDILHRVNNIANTNIKQMIEMAIEEKAHQK